jgi:hypothetical protein
VTHETLPPQQGSRNADDDKNNTMAFLAVMAGLVDARMDAVKAELMGVFRDQLDSMLVEISRDYKIDLEELQEKYEIYSDPKTPAPPKAPVVRAPAKARKAKSDSEGEDRKKCEAKTAKGAACKNFALAGGCLCACHSKGKAKPAQTLRSRASKGGVKPVDPPSSDSESDEKPKATRPVKKAAPKKVEIESDSESETEASVKSPVKSYKRPGKKVPVVHTHGMDDEVHDGCDACEVIGNVMADSLADAEKVVVPPEVMKELDALFESDDEETEDEGEEASLDEIDE